MLTLENVKIGISHFPEDIHFFKNEKIQVFIHGHTHYPSISESPEGVLVVCPGSLLNPRPNPSRFGFLQEAVPRSSVAFLTIESDHFSAIIKPL